MMTQLSSGIGWNKCKENPPKKIIEEKPVEQNIDQEKAAEDEVDEEMTPNEQSLRI